MPKKILALGLLLLLFVVSCEKKQEAVKKATYPIMTNRINVEEMFSKIPAMKTELENYQPDSAAIGFLKNFSQDITVTILLGTWCPDSRREVPRFLKVMSSAHNPHFQYELFGLDRAKKDSLGMGEKFAVEYVPTFVVLKNGKEIGRIIETPTETIEQDLVEILLNAAGN
ncbi:MAG: thioredoxin family protein [Calditrichaeota bacterium]|nr:thioredoxin family protein [Calditrichota bacterium]